MALENIIGLAHGAVLKDKVNYALVKAAIAVMAEDDTTPNHANRIVFAGKVLTGNYNVQQYAIAVATNVTTAGKLDTGKDYDSDLDFVIGSMFDAFATAYANEVQGG